MSTEKEGGSRPLCESTPVSPAAAPLYAAPQPAPKAAPLPRAFAAAALVSYLPAWLYVRGLWYVNDFYGWGIVVFPVVFLLCVEGLARAMRRPAAKETPLWAGGWLTLSLCLWLYGEQGGLGLWPALAWHLFAIWYVLARCGMLAAGHSGSLSFLDALAGMFTIPWPGMTLRVRALWQGVGERLQNRTSPQKRPRAAMAAGSAALALVLCAFAWGQLAAADENFAAIGGDVWRWLRGFEIPFLAENFACFLLSLPVGAWLFGLVAGSLRRQQPPCPAARFWQRLAPLQRLPRFTACLVLGALCAVYALFFGVEALSFAAAALPSGVLRLTAPSASRFAVSGFWELCRVLLLNFAVLAGVRFFGPELRKERLVKALAVLFSAFGIAFALLAGTKLGVYIHLYALTPRRVVSGWFLAVLTLWAVLSLLWALGVRVPFGHVRLGLYAFVLSFLLLNAADINYQVMRYNVTCYRAGQTDALDVGVLRECRVGDYFRSEAGVLDRQAQYARWLDELDWFTGRTDAEMWPVYDYQEHSTAAGAWVRICHPAPGLTLTLTFEGGVCTGSTLTEN